MNPARGTVAVNDIVQANPETSHWGPALVVVSEVKLWGIQGYTYVPGPDHGAAYIRLKWEDFEPTGGRAVWIDPNDEEANQLDMEEDDE